MKRIVQMICVCFITLLSIQNTSANSSLQLTSEYAYLIDPQTEIVYINQKGDEKIYPASMTKILTVSLALEKIADLDEKVIIEQADFAGLAEMGASVAGFYVGERVTYRDLLYGALLPSGADACQALARLTYGNVSTFVEAMNQKIKDLDLKQTHFCNVTGLHEDNHYTTPKEMAMILEYALQNEEFVHIFEARTYQSSKGNHTWDSALQRAQNSNIDVSFINGAKSGFTYEAELTLASTMTIDTHQLILVTAYAKGQYTQNHIKDAVLVYQYMQENYHHVVIYKKDEEIEDYWFMHTFYFDYSYHMPQELALLVDKNISRDDLNVSIMTQKIRMAPINKGEQLGLMTISYDKDMIYQYPMILDKTIPLDVTFMIIFYGCLVVIMIMILSVGYKTVKKKR